MNTSQNVVRMSSVSRDTSRERVTPLTGGCNNNRVVQLYISTLFRHTTQSLFQFCKTSSYVLQNWKTT